jgi:elongation factor Ts
VPADVIAGERKIYEEQARTGGKPENIIERIVDGKVEAFFKQYVLLDQPYIRDDSKTVQELVNEIGVKVGEKVAVRRFARYRLGEDG